MSGQPPPDPSRRAFFRPGATRPPEPDRPAVAQVASACLALQLVECRLCGEGCEAGAIRFPPRLGGVAAPVVDAARCTGCGDCLPLCPTQALALRAAPG